MRGGAVGVASGGGNRRRGQSVIPKPPSGSGIPSEERRFTRAMSMRIDGSEWLNIIVSTLYSLMSLLALRFPFETEETVVYNNIRGGGLLILIILLVFVHTLKVMTDEHEDFATWLYYRNLTFDSKQSFYWKGISHLFGYILIVIVGISSGVNLHFTKNSYALGVMGIVGAWINSVLSAWPKSEDIYCVERIKNSASGLLKKMKRFHGFACEGRMKVYEVDDEYRSQKVPLATPAVWV